MKLIAGERENENNEIFNVKQLLLPDEVKLKCYLTRAALPLREIFPVTVVPFNTVTNNGPKKLAVFNEGFFFDKKMYGGFRQAAKKSDCHIKEVAVRQGFTVL